VYAIGFISATWPVRASATVDAGAQH